MTHVSQLFGDKCGDYPTLAIDLAKAAFTLQVLIPKSDFLTISDFFDDLPTSCFKKVTCTRFLHLHYTLLNLPNVDALTWKIK